MQYVLRVNEIMWNEKRCMHVVQPVHGMVPPSTVCRCVDHVVIHRPRIACGRDTVVVVLVSN